MNRIHFKMILFVSILSALVLSFNLLVGAQEQPGTQEKSKTKERRTGTQTGTEQEKGKAAPSGAATLKATLVNPEKSAQKKEATVEVKVSGIRLTDPEKANEQPKKGQGHIHYKVDNGPVIATTATKLSFHQLSSGEHKITVTLAANDHSPLGPEETLTVKVP